MSGALSLLPLAQQLFVDANGRPLAGGQVTFYAPGTQTYATVYSDSAGSNPLANPATLDADGFAQPSGQIWGSGSFRQVVQDALGNTIWDNVTSAIAISDAMVPVLEAATTAAAAALLGLGKGIIIPCGATMTGTAISLTRNTGTNAVSSTILGLFFCFLVPTTTTGPFTLSETTDSIPSATLYDGFGNAITSLLQNQFCVIGWNPNFGSSGGWALVGSQQQTLAKWSFTASGTWTCPPGITSVFCSGTGGGGAGNIGASQQNGGGGGGGAQATNRQVVAVTPFLVYAVNIGAGGATAGQDGAATTFITPSFTTLVSLAGGKGGMFGSTNSALSAIITPGGNAGGAGGENGGPGWCTYEPSTGHGSSFGGPGGSTIFGSGGNGGIGYGTTPGGYGGGGGGGSTSYGSGAGASGYFLIETT